VSIGPKTKPFLYGTQTNTDHTTYEIIENEGSYWGEIPGLQGVWARHKTLEGCRRELREALSDWLASRYPHPKNNEIMGRDAKHYGCGSARAGVD
jgi:predicted RNase H-like HicB family nuclease